MPLVITLTTPGNYTVEDNGVVGDFTSVVRDGNGAIVRTFTHPSDLLAFLAGPGVNITVNFTDPLGGAELTVGSLTNAAVSPDSVVVNNINSVDTVTIVANGAITEAGSDAGADIVAGAIILSAQTGIGTPGNALETQTDGLEAETVTGGINLANSGDLYLGGLSSAVEGLDVATSGDISLVNAGTILLSDTTGTEIVHGGTSSGNVTLIANGANANITGGIDRDAIMASGGNITLHAERDISIGTFGNYDNDVSARGSVTVTAGRNFIIDGRAVLASDAFGAGTGGNVTITVGSNINLLNGSGPDAGVVADGTAGADIVLTTGAGGALTVNTSWSAGTLPLKSLVSNSGDITINADRMLIGATGVISAAQGNITIAPMTAGRGFNLGSATDSGSAMEMSDQELDRFAARELWIGSFDSGNAAVVGALTLTGLHRLAIRTGGDASLLAGITLAATATAPAPLLQVLAGDDVTQQAGGILAASQVAIYVDQVGSDGGAGGTATMNGSVNASHVMTGNADPDHLLGTAGIDILNGAGGADVMEGRGSDDSYMVDNAGDVVVEAAGFGGADQVRASVSYTLGAGVHVELLRTGDNAGTAAINLTGNELNNILTGNGGANVLDGSAGVDTMNGLLGDDFYYVDNAGDVVIEGASEGAADRIFASASYTLGAGVHVEKLTTTNNSGTGAINLNGNELANLIYGNAGANILDGGAGADTLIGLGGNDSYLVDNAADFVIESASEGAGDRIYSSVSYTLGAGVHVETLSTDLDSATTAINLTGNELTNTLYGNAGANRLDGKGGADVMAGLGGNDLYRVDNAGDVIVEGAADGAYDRVYTSVSYTLAAGVWVEQFATADDAGTAALNLTGNERANLIYGNAGNNILDGRVGADTLIGLGGDDYYYVDNAADLIVEGVGEGVNDRIFTGVNYVMNPGIYVEKLSTLNNVGTTPINLSGNERANTIYGNAGVNFIDGKGGTDVLVGLEGADNFVFTIAPGGANADTISDFLVVDDTIRLDDAAFAGLVVGALPAGAFNTGSAATQADDRIIYNSATGALWFDADGTGATAAVQFATVTAGLAMTATDFIVV